MHDVHCGVASASISDAWTASRPVAVGIDGLCGMLNRHPPEAVCFLNKACEVSVCCSARCLLTGGSCSICEDVDGLAPEIASVDW